MLRRNKIFLTVAVIATLLIAMRAALPYVVKDYVNDTLRDLKAYEGSVDDVDLAIWRGAYRIDGIRIVKRGADRAIPFFSGDRVDFSVEWSSLFKGSLVSEVVFIGPNLNLIQEESAEKSQLGQEENWQRQLRELFPFRFNTIEVRNGTVTFLAPGIQTKDALEAKHLNGTVTNLTNVADANKETFADFSMDATVLDSSPAKVSGSLDPWAQQATFDVDLEVKAVSLPKVNPWLRQYIKADAESGEFELFLELAAAEGKFKGYAKPILRNVNITSSEEEESNPLRKLWEGIVEFAANVLENEQEDQVAARVPFSGTVENPQAGVWPTIISVLRNAFVSAFARSLEGSISLRDVKKNLDKYGGDEDVKEGENDADNDKRGKEADKNDAPRKAGPRASSS